MLSLKEVLDRYSLLAQQSGEPVALSGFQLSPDETSRLFTALDDDYHISRFLTFSAVAGPTFQVSGNAVTHVQIDPAIRELL